MAKPGQHLLDQLVGVFFEEAEEGLASMEAGLLEIDQGATSPELVNRIFRAAHSIKGGAGTFGFNDLVAFTHHLETLLDEARSGKRGLEKPLVEVLLHAVDHLRSLVEGARSGTAVDPSRSARVIAELEAFSGAKAPRAPAVTPGAHTGKGRWRIHFAPHAGIMARGNDPLLILRELSALGEARVTAFTETVPELEALDPEVMHLSWTVELEADCAEAAIREAFAWVEDDCRLEIQHERSRVAEAPAAAAASAPAPANVERGSPDAGSIRVSIDKIDALVNMVGELVITQSMLGQIGKSFDMAKLSRLRDGLAQLERNTRELQDNVMRIRMLPIRFVFSRFPRMVRDLAQQLGKKVHLVLSGEATELDKTVLEKIGDPLVHMVRNAVDHGIEAPELRRSAGKAEEGTITLNAFHQGSTIVIEVRDDGRGLDPERILKKARERGLVAAEDRPTDEELFDLLFAPGFSTAEQVSDVSGRGVGLDVVRRNIRELGGTVELTSRAGRGTTFSIRLPLTLAILDGQLVRVGEQTYIVPIVSIIESLQMQAQYLNAVAGRLELYRLRESYIPVLRLDRLFGHASTRSELAGGLLMVVEENGRRVGLLIDDLLEQQQVVIKSLDANFRRVQGVSGATILGDGTVALILDIAGLISSAKDAAERREQWRTSELAGHASKHTRAPAST